MREEIGNRKEIHVGNFSARPDPGPHKNEQKKMIEKGMTARRSSVRHAP